MKLITLRLEKNITQKELADALGIDKILISQYEDEILKPEYATVQKLADFFGDTIDYLIGEPKIETISYEEPAIAINNEIKAKTLKKQDLKQEYLEIAKEI